MLKQLSRQSSSFGKSGRTRTEDQEFLAKNASREEVIVLPSGVQLELLEKKTITTTTNNVDKNILKNSIFLVKKYDAKGVLIGQESLEPATICRGLKEALLSGLLHPGTRWKLWIPAESGPRSNSNNDIIVTDLEIVSIAQQPNYVFKIILGFVAILISSTVSWFFQKKKVISQRKKLTDNNNKINNDDNDNSLFSVKFDFDIDGSEIGSCNIEVLNPKIANLFSELCKKFEFNGRRILPTAADGRSLIVEPFDRNISKPILVNWEDQMSVPVINEKCYFVFISSQSSSLLISPFASIPKYLEDELWIFVGCAPQGNQAFQIISNCDDGGVITKCEVVPVNYS